MAIRNQGRAARRSGRSSSDMARSEAEKNRMLAEWERDLLGLPPLVPRGTRAAQTRSMRGNRSVSKDAARSRKTKAAVDRAPLTSANKSTKKEDLSGVYTSTGARRKSRRAIRRELYQEDSNSKQELKSASD